MMTEETIVTDGSDVEMVNTEVEGEETELNTEDDHSDTTEE